MWKSNCFRRKLYAGIVLLAFLVTTMVGTPAFAEETSPSLAAGSYIVSLLKYDGTIDSTNLLTAPTTSSQPQISEVGILDVAADGTMKLTYKLYAASVWTKTIVSATSEEIEKRTANEQENTAYMTVALSNWEDKIILTGSKGTVNVSYGIRITAIGPSVEMLENAVQTGQMLQYDFTYDVYKTIRQYNYITASTATGYNADAYADIFEQNVTMTTTSSSIYPVTATYTIKLP